MKIGILTYHSVFNCGAILQSFALKKQLELLGHKVYYINYVHNIDWNIKQFIGRTPISFYHKYLRIYKILRYGYLNNFNDILSNFTKRYYNIEELKKNPPDFDVYIAGSDQIWNLSFLKNENEIKIFFLDFGSKNIKRIAYAPSMGDSDISLDNKKLLNKLLLNFDSISVRENESIDILKSINRNLRVNLIEDPTLLLNKEQYIKELNLKTEHNNNKLTTYLLHNINNQQKDFIDYFIKTNNLNHINIITPEYGVDKWEAKCYAKPKTCLTHFLNSKYIITNSFHGVMFSLIFHKNFLALDYNILDKTNKRINSILASVNLENRLVKPTDIQNYEKIIKTDINWELVDKELKKMKEKNIVYLKTSLS